MKKLIVIMLTALMLAGCSTEAELENKGRFAVIEDDGYWLICVDRETRVMYTVSAGYYNRGTVTLLVDANGDPLIYDGEVEK